MRQWLDSRLDFGFIPALWLDARFRSRYERVPIQYAGQTPQVQSVYVRRDRMALRD